MPHDSAAVATPPATVRSAISNGSRLFNGVDGRGVYARRLKDLMALHLSDLGGDDAVSEAQRSIVRRAATLEIELETLEGTFAAAGQAKPDQLDLYQRTAGNLRRLLQALGLRRVPRDVTPRLSEYLAGRAQGAVP